MMERAARNIIDGREHAATPRVTAIIDTYNYGRFLEDAVESVLSQDFPPEELEILVVDDGSTDDTAERMKKYAGRVEYCYKANGGQASAFNCGIARARGEIVALLDADDYWLPGKLRRIAGEFERNPDVGFVYHPLRRMKTETGEWQDGPFDAIAGDVPSDIRKLLRYTATQTSGMAFRRRLASQLLPLNEAIKIDADAVLSALIIFLAPVAAVPEQLGIYRIHGANLYFESNSEGDKLRLIRRITNLNVVIGEIDRWLTAHGYDLQGKEVLAFRRRWRLMLEKEQFRYEAPGRVHFFLHLVRAMTCMNPCLNAKIQTVNMLNLVGCLIFGYEDYTRLDDWRIFMKNIYSKDGATRRSRVRSGIRDGAEGHWQGSSEDQH